MTNRLIKIMLALSIIVLLLACKKDKKKILGTNEDIKYENIGSVEIIQDELDQFFESGAQAEIIADDFAWAEGPVWIEAKKMLLCSDVKKNTIYQWTEANGKEVFLESSGYTGSTKRGGEMGSNGLALRTPDELIVCQHGDRAVSLLAATWDNPRPKFIQLASQYSKMQFNSPNDLYIDSSGNIYFTDPPYGLEDKGQLPMNGVYKLYPNGTLNLVYSKLTRPNGLMYLPDQNALIVANSDPEDAKWYKLTLDDLDRTIAKEVYHDPSALVGQELGLPDGMTMHPDGYLFATGPGGVWVFNPAGELIGKVKTPKHTSNCTFDQRHEYLYMTADDLLLRIKLKA